MPKGSCDIYTSTAYLIDHTHGLDGKMYLEICTTMKCCIKDHNDWWVCLTWDGFSSHIRAEAYHIFNRFKIMTVLEDRDISQANQLFDQQKSKRR